MSNILTNEKKKWLSNLVLASFLLLVGATIFLSNAFKTPIKGHNEFIEQTQVFNNKELENITSLTLKNKSGEYTFQRPDKDSSTWHMTSPKEISSNSVFIQKLFESLQTIKTKKLLTDDHVNNSNFSLEKPTAILTLSDAEGKSLLLSVGIMNTIDNSTYLKISGKSGIYHVEAPSVSLETLTINDLIESNVFKINFQDMTGFKIFRKNSAAPQFEAKKKDNVWVNALEKPLDAKKFEEIIEDIKAIKSSYIIDSPTDAQKKQTQALVSPAEYVVKIESGPESLTYQIGNVTKSLPDLALNEEPHFIIIENHAPVIYVVKKEMQTLFDFKE